MQTPLYTATVRMQIDRSRQRWWRAVIVIPSDFDENFMQTQYQLLQQPATG